MTNSYFCRKPCNHVGLFKRRGCLICQCIFLSIVLSLLQSSPFLPALLAPLLRLPAVIPLSFFSLNAKMYPRAVCGSWSITVHRSAYSVSHKSSISCSALPASWPLFLQESGVLGRQGQANSPLPSHSLSLCDWHSVQVPSTLPTVHKTITTNISHLLLEHYFRTQTQTLCEILCKMVLAHVYYYICDIN